MTELQAAAIAKANAAMRPALDLYEERCYLWHLSCRIPLPDLQRLNALLRRLSDMELKMVAAFAEGLAEWSSGDTCSIDAKEANRETAGKATEVADSAG